MAETGPITVKVDVQAQGLLVDLARTMLAGRAFDLGFLRGVVSRRFIDPGYVDPEAIDRVAPLIDAMRTVLDLHLPHFWTDELSRERRVTCPSCPDPDEALRVELDWPCPTAKAVLDALGVEQ